jgi:hypothetical protein
MDKRTKIRPDNAGGRGPRSTPEFAERLPKAVEACADRIVHHQRRIADQDQTPIDHLLEKTGSGAGKNAYSLEELLSAVVELQVLVSARERFRSP